MMPAKPTVYRAEDYLPHLGLICNALDMYRYGEEQRVIDVDEFRAYKGTSMEGFDVVLVDRATLVRVLSQERRQEIQKTIAAKKLNPFTVTIGVAALAQGFLVIPGLLIYSFITGVRLRGGSLTNVAALVGCIAFGFFLLGPNKREEDLKKMLLRSPVQETLDIRMMGAETPRRVLSSPAYYPYFHNLELIELLQRAVLEIYTRSSDPETPKAIADKILSIHSLFTNQSLRDRLAAIEKVNIKDIFTRWDALGLFPREGAPKSNLDETTLITEVGDILESLNALKLNKN